MTRAICASFALATMLQGSYPFGASWIAGRWLTADGSAVVAIEACGDHAMCGRIVSVLNGPPDRVPLDTNNPDRKLKTRSLIGVKVLSDLKLDQEAWHGVYYDHRTGETYSASVTRDGSRLNVKAYRGYSLISRKLVWTVAG